MKRLLLILLAISVAACESPSTPASPTPVSTECPPVEVVDGVNVIPSGAPAECVYIQGLPFDQPSVPGVDVPVTPYADWSNANKVNGFGTTYDAYQHARSWYDNKKGTWVWVDPENKGLTKASCKAHPEWKCYYLPSGKLVRPWKSDLDDMYAALGPLLRKHITLPRWHSIPTQKVLVTSMVTHISIEVWVADYCACGGRDKKQNTRDDSLIDLSPEVWKALGVRTNPKNGVRYAIVDGKSVPWTNKIEVRFLP